MNYIDLHCHILPGIDDGPSTKEQSLALARELVLKGFSKAIATPHYVDDFSPEYKSRIEKEYKSLSQALKENKIPLDLYIGGEILLTPDVAKLAKERKLPTLNGTSYVLLELPLYQPIPLYTLEVLFQLQAYGYKPILAHPERIEHLKTDISFLYKLVRRDVYLQVNLGSLAGTYGEYPQDLAQKLIKNNLAHFLATDSHDASLVSLLESVFKLASFSLEYYLQNNPDKILRDTELNPLPFKPPMTIRKKIKKIFKI